MSDAFLLANEYWLIITVDANYISDDDPYMDIYEDETLKFEMQSVGLMELQGA